MTHSLESQALLQVWTCISRDVFSAGASHYGVADLELLAQETHKFESRYLDQLIGPYPAEKQIYVERSPIHALDKFTAPTAFFQVRLVLSKGELVDEYQETNMVNLFCKQGIMLSDVSQRMLCLRGMNLQRSREADWR